MLAFGGFFFGYVLAGILGATSIAVTGDAEGPALLAASFVGLWLSLIAVSLLASRRFGTKSIRRDLGFWFEKADLWRGVLVGVIGLLAATGVQYALSLFPDLVGTNTNFIEEQTDTIVGAVVVALSTMVGAPLVEELFFRGLLQRSLARIGIAAAFVQALVFGSIHFTPDEGLGNVGIILGVGVFGMVLGLASRHYGRLGPAIVGHAVFNAAAVVPLLLR